MNEVEQIIREHRKEERIRSMTKPKKCFVFDQSYIDAFCDPYMARSYRKRARQKICLECQYWFGFEEHDYLPKGCQKPFGIKHLFAIIRNILWKLRWKLPPLDKLYIYQFRLKTRRIRATERIKIQEIIESIVVLEQRLELEMAFYSIGHIDEETCLLTAHKILKLIFELKKLSRSHHHIYIFANYLGKLFDEKKLEILGWVMISQKEEEQKMTKEQTDAMHKHYGKWGYD